ncbi:SpoIIE family protein phosphatase [Pseudonocardia sp. KRD-184]|uniref:SpoIIE family protein phosphatase n=1 Tax=Pseudonocardia oceani TaxID=2792013 RepID=A0ABS6UBM6_9PSEU|nr:SpoIIE family protein phosphatase [Pseudonocardia oceani]MBW0089476.1 SpoIIE family protein phosphatase [Pseudonocardia oceani]MBW0096490.1 SpoIIE family protein phosphatase [Pseudonocardia oceani]MBW0109421.1 SpoIIE family protein phosphatase [Pseudonocardia oceani]MBW0123333.1 SpoIIE family protein phosphatase [Pseudonocardia oceani]MBW0129311.1 SpoIIE family protein phosphatase [Pseudonocardia oceani]
MDDEPAELRRQLALLRLLTDATAALSGAATPMQVAEVAVEQYTRLLGTSSVAVFELRGRDSLDAMTLGGWVEGARDAWTTMPLDAPAPVAEAARTRTPVWTESPAAWRERYPHLVGMLDGYGYRGVFGLPLLAGDELVGALGVGLTEDRTLDGAERAAVTALGAQCAQAMQRARLLQVESEARRTAERFSAMVAALSRSRTPDEVVSAIGEAAASLGATASVVAVRTEDRIDLSGGAGASPLPLDVAHPLSYAVRTGEPVWLARRSELAWRDRSFAASPGAPEVDVAVPMFLDDRATGAIGMSFAGAPPHFSREERRAIRTLAAQCAQALDRARLQQVEHDIAEALQRNLLPVGLPRLAELAFAARYLPGTEGVQAGGDWYEVVELDGGRVAMVVGDVVGKGAEAAALMGQLRTALSAALLRGDSPAQALRQLDAFSVRVPAARASTAACVLVDRGTGALTWASAGHPAPLLLSADGARLLEGPPGPVLGVRAGDAFPEHRSALPVGAVVVLYTDGLVERRDEDLDVGLARLEAAGSRSGDRPLDQVVDGLLEDLLGPAGPGDDVAVVLCRRTAPPWSRRIPARAEELGPLRREVERWGSACGLHDDHLYDLQIALGEAVANGVEHAFPEGPGEVAIALARRGDGSVAVEVGDSGTWRPAPADPGHRGRGLAVIHALARDVEVVPGEGGTRVSFRVPPAPPDAPPVRTGTGTGQRTWTGQRPARRDARMEVRHDDTGPCVVVSGDLDLLGATALRDGLRAVVDAAEPGSRLVVDLAGAGYVASAGVALLLDTLERARGRGLTAEVAIPPGGALARILAVSGAGGLGAG